MDSVPRYSLRGRSHGGCQRLVSPRCDDGRALYLGGARRMPDGLAGRLQCPAACPIEVMLDEFDRLLRRLENVFAQRVGGGNYRS